MISTLRSAIVRGTATFCKALSFIVKKFYRLIVIQLVAFFALLFTLARGTVQTPLSPTAAVLMIPLGLTFTLLMFLFSASMVVLFRDISRKYSAERFRIGIFRYAQFMLVGSFLLYFFVALLISFGIVRFPQIHWTVVSMLSHLGLFSMFYWLDSKFSLRDIPYSIERGVNMYIYNLVYVVPLGLLGIAATFGVQEVALLVTRASAFDLTVLTRDTLKELAANKSILFGGSFLLYRFVKIGIQFFTIACMYELYRMKKNVKYRGSFFSNDAAR